MGFIGRLRLMGGCQGELPVLSGEYVAKEGEYVTYAGERYVYDEDVISVLCIGVDARGRENTVGQADTDVIAVFNTRERTVRLLCINRDSIGPVKLYDVAGRYITTQDIQIAVAYSYGESAAQGAALMTEAVSGLLDGLPIHAWVSVDIDGIGELNSAVGGVTLTALEDVEKAGIVQGQRLTLTDEQALYYITERDSASEEIGTNAARMDRQRQYIKLWLEAVSEDSKYNLPAVYGIYKRMKPYVTTDMSVCELLYLARMYENCKISDDDVYTLPGEYTRSGYYDRYEVDEQGLTEVMLELFYRKVE